MKDKTVNPETLLNFGKHKGKTFIYVYENDSNYVNWAKSIPNPKGELIDFLNFVSNHEMCNNLHNEDKYSDYKQIKNNKYTINQNYIDQEPTTPKSYKLESNSIHSKSESSFKISDTSIKRQKYYDDPTPGDISFIRDVDYKEEKLKLSPSLRHILDKLEEGVIDTQTEGSIKIDGVIALVLFSEDEFYLSYSKNENNMGWWTPNIPIEISSIVSKLGLTTYNRMLGRTKCVTYKAEDYSTVLKALRSGIQNKNNIEPVPNFVLRTFPEFFNFSRESEVEDKTRQVLEGSQDDYTLAHMDNMQNMIGDVLWNKLMPFQRDGVLFGLGRNGRVLIGDEMGLGKTLQALAISAFYIQDWPLLIICPSSIRFQWLEQCLTWLPHLVNENEILMVKTSRHLESCVVNDNPKGTGKKKKGMKKRQLDLSYNSIDFENKFIVNNKKNNKYKEEEDEDYDEEEEEEEYYDDGAIDDFDDFIENDRQNNYYRNSKRKKIKKEKKIKIKKEENEDEDNKDIYSVNNKNKQNKNKKDKKKEEETKTEEYNKEKENKINGGLFDEDDIDEDNEEDIENEEEEEYEEDNKKKKIKKEKKVKVKEEKENKIKIKKEDDEDKKHELYLGCYKIVIVSYDLLVRMKELDGFKTVICDESHYLKSRSSQRSRRIVPMLKEAKRTVLLSGTPAVNFPAELYQQLSSIIPAFSCYSVFVERYCKKKFNFFSKKMEYTDSKHAHELHLFLVKTVMIRRLKYEVMKELPSKIRSKIPIEVSDKVVKMTSMMQDQYREYIIERLSLESGRGSKKGSDGKDPQTNLDSFVVKKNDKEENKENKNKNKENKMNGGLFDDEDDDNKLNKNKKDKEKEENEDPDVEAIRKEIFDKFGGDWEINLKRKGSGKRTGSKDSKKSNKNKDKENKNKNKENEDKQENKESKEDNDEDIRNSSNMNNNRITVMPRLFFMTGEAKIKGVCKYIEEILENNNKFIIFAHHIFMLDAIEETLKSKKVTYIRIDGSTNINARAKMVQDFQRSAKKDESVYSDLHSCSPDKLKNNGVYEENKENGNEVRVALLSITACGVGLNLTASSTVIFAELYWVPGKLLQAEDRVHRIGSEFRSVNIHYLIAQNSIDEVIWKVVNNKQMSLTATLDGAVSNIAISGLNKKRW